MVAYFPEGRTTVATWQVYLNWGQLYLFIKSSWHAKCEKIAQLKYITDKSWISKKKNLVKKQAKHIAVCCDFEEWFCTKWYKVMKLVLIEFGPKGQGLSFGMNNCESPHYWLTDDIKTLYKMLPFKQNITLSEIIKQFYFPQFTIKL